MATLNELWADHTQKNATITEIVRNIGDADPTDDQIQQVKGINEQLEKIELAIKAAQERQQTWQGLSQQATTRAAAANTPVYTVPFAGDGNPTKGMTDGQSVSNVSSLSNRVFSDPDFKDFLQRKALGGNVTRAQFGNSPAIAFKSLITGLSDTSGGPLVVADRKPLIDFPFRPLTIRDIITVGTTGSDLVEYARVTGYTNAAAPVAEATDVSGGTGSKPQSTLGLELVQANVKTIAHWVGTSRRALADAGQLRTLIDTFLRYGLEEELEDQMIAGDGVGENFLGLLNTPNTQSQSFVTDLVVTLRKALTKVRVVGHAQPTAYVMHPNDWETLDLMADNEHRYYFGGPMVLGVPRIWGLPVVQSEAMTAGTAMVGDFRTVVLWDREQAQIMVSDSHSDFFTRNLIAILAEMRAAFGVTYPAALVEIALS